jgi:hypothetical protein
MNGETTEVTPRTCVTYNGEAHYGNDFARWLGVGYPDSNTSAGATWLLEIADTYLTERNRVCQADYPEDELIELAGDCVPVPTHRKWQIFLDLTLYSYDSELLFSTGTNKDGESYYELTQYNFIDVPDILLDELAGNLMNMLYNQDEERPDADDETDANDHALAHKLTDQMNATDPTPGID